DRVLELVHKGVTAARHIEAGRRVKDAGMELSEYVMPGLGGRALTTEHAQETARVLRAIDPHFIRLRTLAIARGSPLAELCETGRFEPLGDLEIVQELRELVDGLADVTSTIRSDHVLNLLEEISGKLPDDRPRLLAALDRFLGLDDERRDAFVVGRRLGILRRLDDLEDPVSRGRAEAALGELRRRFPGPIDAAIRELMTRFV
ncbi:MAG: radical SAM protein, partial [Deltaproteobacteria bacterium]|nr:radical SAM protein [Deltaproteobacteria bacterium]MBW2530642.1 radical SAM protein [Deltaproteobacteria bacterium]